MNPSKPQSVKGFLTPTKLLSAIAKQPPKNKNSNINKSPYSPRNQKQYSKQKFGDSRASQYDQKNKSLSNFVMGHHNYNQKTHNNNNKLNQSTDNHNRDDNYFYGTQNSYQNFKDKTNQNQYQLERQKQKINLYGSRHSKASNKNNLLSHGNKNHNNASYIHTKQLIQKLQNLKKSLQYQISSLQSILDETSTHLQNIDNEYQKFKKSVLNYTASYLDAAFTEYKKSMDWVKYQQFQKSGIAMLTQINKMIVQKQSDMQNLNNIEDSEQDLHKHQKAQAWANLANRQIEGKIQQLNQIVKDLEVIRKECVSMRPTITQQRMKRYQQAVIQLGKF